MFWFGFLVGILMGAPVLTFVLALLTSSKKADEQIERMIEDVSNQ
jgi:hypothetical protein